MMPFVYVLAVYSNRYRATTLVAASPSELKTERKHSCSPGRLVAAKPVIATRHQAGRTCVSQAEAK